MTGMTPLELLLASLAACAVEPAPRDAVETIDTGRDSAPDSAPPDSGDTAPIDAVDSGPLDTSPIDTGEPPPTTWRSALYPADWTPALINSEGRFLHDFSYAGYHAGEAALPSPPGPSFVVTDFGADATGTSDSTSAIQAAIDAASASAPAVVELPAGTFRLDGTLRVATSGVVLRGAGSTSTFVYFTKTSGVDYAAHLTFAGTASSGADRLLSADTPARTFEVPLADTTGIVVGDEVQIGAVITDEFVADHGMTDVWYSFNGDWRAFFRRTVTAVGAASITVDVPLRSALATRDSASVRVVTGALTECGLQDLAIANANDWDTTWTTTQVHAVIFSNVKDCWVTNVVSWASPLGDGFHLMSSGIEVLDSRRVTIADSTLELAQHRGDGGNGYLFEISRSNEVLTRDTTARAGRHNFIQNWDFGTSGCVWLRTMSEDGRSLYADWDPIGWPSYSEYHHSLATANLVDQSVATDGWQGVNRQGESSGAGHSATESVWWNTSGGGYLRSFQYGNGYVIGTDGMDVHVDVAEVDWNNSSEGTEPEDWTEGLDEAATLEPASLYEDQLTRRLGR
ncbi:hypothetical protein LBMAG42_35930 [Deltaproteobacteria bacterium]|nr:hypothetical protein LBMAG42_35930 [Deltaproteobacteria bacterium]